MLKLRRKHMKGDFHSLTRGMAGGITLLVFFANIPIIGI
jgi:hypothetical protein